MKFPWLYLHFGIFFIPLITGRGYRNCIQNMENTFNCVNRLEVTIQNVVSDLPATAEYLTITYNTIRKLPSMSFENLPDLQHLNLMKNNLDTIDPGAFNNLTALTNLTLSYNKISSLRNGTFKGLTHLMYLYLQQNAITFIDPDVFGPLLRLKSLNLSDNSLSNFSNVIRSIQPLQNLENLTLCSNNISLLNHSHRLPSKLSTLFLCKNHLHDLTCHQDFFENISYLDLSYNNINTISLQNLSLVKVRYLHIAFNPNFNIFHFLKTSTIKPENIDYSGLHLNTFNKLRKVCQHLKGRNISNLKLLENGIGTLSKNPLNICSPGNTLDLSRNRLKSICLRFLVPSNLKSVIVEHNLLKQLKSCSNKLIFLKSISFRYNRIWSVNSYAFAFSPNLEELLLNINNILFLEMHAFGGLERLKLLRLDNNLITDLYNVTFKGLHELTILNLRNNRVSVIFENVFIDLTKLNILDLGGNKITHVEPGAFNGLKNLSKLYLDRNQIRIISWEMFNGVETTLQVLDLSANYLNYESRRPSSPLSKLEKLYDLKLQAQQPFGLNYIPKGFFTGLYSLQSLYLSQNRLTNLSSDIFLGLRNLTFLSLGEDCNGIQNLSPGIFNDLVSLQVMNLENMCLQTLDNSVFSNLTNLRKLLLTKNALRTLDINVLKNMTNLTYLDLNKCPLTCTCDNEDLQQWLNSSSVQVINRYNLTCPSDPSVYFHNFDVNVCDVILKKRLFCCSFVALILLLVIPTVYLKSYWRIRYNYFLFLSWLHERLHSDKDMYKYDAFVSYNTKDEEWVYQKMLPTLENSCSSTGLRLCLHHRDFQLGRDIIDNIVDSIHNSRKTICVVSRSYLRSEWCSMEMQLASYKLFDEMRDVLVLIFLENISDRELSTYHRMRKVMLKKTYIKWPEESEAQNLFWTKVLKAIKGSSTDNSKSISDKHSS
ncbi:uncharacterized protein PAF06_016527 [Gastrophryne carolinensis]